MQKWSP